MRSAKLQIANRKSQVRQRGYMMITLMLTITLLMIAMLAVLPRVHQQIQRDREEEMIHRGTAYMRAIQHFYTKLGRYPTRVEELENTNNIRYLRKRYTDPLSWDPATHKERDFKFLHQADILLNNGPVLGQVPQSGLGGSGNTGALMGLLQQAAGGNTGALLAGLQQAGAPPNAAALLSTLQQAGGLGNAGALMSTAQQAGATSEQIAELGDALNPPSSNPSSGSSSSGNSPDTGGSSNSSGSSSSSSSSSSGPGPSGQVFGGGPILGVASTSKAKSIREFYGKSHYKDWLFIYMPQAVTLGLLTGPVNPGAPTTNFNGANSNPAQIGGPLQTGFTPPPGQPQDLSNQSPQNPTPPQQ